LHPEYLEMSESKIRVWLASLTMGLATSLILTAAMRKTQFGFWLPGTQPGWMLAWATRFIWPNSAETGVALVTGGNTAFYAWIFSRILRAEILARGSLSRYFLR
jgi:hypothetical protein